MIFKNFIAISTGSLKLNVSLNIMLLDSVLRDFTCIFQKGAKFFSYFVIIRGKLVLIFEHDFQMFYFFQREWVSCFPKLLIISDISDV